MFVGCGVNALSDLRPTNKFCAITAKIAFFCRRTRLRIISEKGPDDSSPVFLLAKRSLEDSTSASF